MELRKLIIECKKQSIPAQRCLYGQYAKRMFLLCRRYVKNDQLAEEAALNGFMRFFNSLKNFEYRSDEATEGCLTKIMVSVCLRQLNKNSLTVVALEQVQDLESEDDILGELSAKEIYKLITRLPTGYRTVFNLYYVEGMNHNEIAAVLNIDSSTSRSQLTKARQLLQEMLIKNNKEYENRKTK